MADSEIPVDLLNPGQVFACLGMLEMAEALQGNAEAAFDWGAGDNVRFRFRADGEEQPIMRILRFLEEAEVVTRAPAGSLNPDRWKSSWGQPPVADTPSGPFPFPDPDSPATLPVFLRDREGNEIALEYWGDATRRDNVKFWAGAGGYPASAILRDALKLVQGKLLQFSKDPFNLSARQSNSFRFDWRRDYIPVQDGFSPNKHGKIVMVGFPLVEICAAIGMTNARPRRSSGKSKLGYTYGVLGHSSAGLLQPVFHRAALGALASPVPSVPFRRFAMRLDWPGREGDARCITHITEEEISS